MILRPNTYDTYTVIVAGTQFSGTSLVAGLLRILGIHMGNTFLPEDTHQDTDFEMEDWKSLIKVVRQRNLDHETWGVKTISIHSHIKMLHWHLRNPIVIYCDRSLSDTLLHSRSKYRHSAEHDWLAHFRVQQNWSEYLTVHAVPVCVIPFGIEHGDLLLQLQEFLRIDATPEQLQAAEEFHGGGYKALKSQPVCCINTSSRQGGLCERLHLGEIT